jgi:hypothetical protein
MQGSPSPERRHANCADILEPIFQNGVTTRLAARIDGSRWTLIAPAYRARRLTDEAHDWEIVPLAFTTQHADGCEFDDRQRGTGGAQESLPTDPRVITRGLMLRISGRSSGGICTGAHPPRGFSHVGLHTVP